MELVRVEGSTVFVKLGGGCGVADRNATVTASLTLTELIEGVKYVLDITDHTSGGPYFAATRKLGLLPDSVLILSRLDSEDQNILGESERHYRIRHLCTYYRLVDQVRLYGCWWWARSSRCRKLRREHHNNGRRDTRALGNFYPSSIWFTAASLRT